MSHAGRTVFVMPSILVCAGQPIKPRPFRLDTTEAQHAIILVRPEFDLWERALLRADGALYAALPQSQMYVLSDGQRHFLGVADPERAQETNCATHWCLSGRASVTRVVDMTPDRIAIKNAKC